MIPEIKDRNILAELFWLLVTAVFFSILMASFGWWKLPFFLALGWFWPEIYYRVKDFFSRE
jgi:hypothetical protein